MPALDKIRSEIGWEPDRSLDEILADVLSYERAAAAV
jgi:nucleoside-diphosphate-sugar epimerase